MDRSDLFIGSEGTLGVVTAVTLRVLPERPAQCLALVPFTDRKEALAFVRRLELSHRHAAQPDPAGVDVSAIEHMDARCLALLRKTGWTAPAASRSRQRPPSPSWSHSSFHPTLTAERAFDEIGRIRDPGAPATPLRRFCLLLAEAGVLDQVDIAVPGDRVRQDQLLAVREGVPAAVNARVARAKQTIDSRIDKTAADMIVPFDRFDALLDFYDAEFRRRGLDAAVWGHISDGNVHPNVIPRSVADVDSGKAAILEFGREVMRLGGAPLAEHGVGRNLVKQQLLRDLYGDSGIEEMRAVKRAIDPEWKLAPGVLFSR